MDSKLVIKGCKAVNMEDHEVSAYRCKAYQTAPDEWTFPVNITQIEPRTSFRFYPSAIHIEVQFYLKDGVWRCNVYSGAIRHQILIVDIIPRLPEDHSLKPDFDLLVTRVLEARGPEQEYKTGSGTWHASIDKVEVCLEKVSGVCHAYIQIRLLNDPAPTADGLLSEVRLCRAWTDAKTGMYSDADVVFIGAKSTRKFKAHRIFICQAEAFRASGNILDKADDTLQMNSHALPCLLVLKAHYMSAAAAWGVSATRTKAWRSSVACFRVWIAVFELADMILSPGVADSAASVLSDLVTPDTMPFLIKLYLTIQHPRLKKAIETYTNKSTKNAEELLSFMVTAHNEAMAIKVGQKRKQALPASGPNESHAPVSSQFVGETTLMLNRCDRLWESGSDADAILDVFLGENTGPFKETEKVADSKALSLEEEDNDGALAVPRKLASSAKTATAPASAATSASRPAKPNTKRQKT